MENNIVSNNIQCKFDNLSYSINSKDILNNISLEINSGDFIAIIGQNGAGKSTLTKILTKMINKTSGKLELFEKDIDKYSRRELAKKIAYIPQKMELSYEFKVEEVVLMGRFPYVKLFEKYSKKDYEIAKNAMIKTNVYELKDRTLENLSGGELQRVMIARVLAQETEIIVLDEPISNLDIFYQIEIMEILKKLNNEENTTIICVLHDINMALKYSEKSVLLNNGLIVDYGCSKKILNRTNISKLFNVDASFFELKIS